MPQERTERVSFRFPPGLMDRMKIAAKADRRTVTSWVENLIAQALDDLDCADALKDMLKDSRTGAPRSGQRTSGTC
jgi:predicted DNA-binding protein